MSYTILYKRGDKGQEVKRLQRALCGLSVDGDFGPKTEKAVRDFQKSNGALVDGVVGPQTRSLLKINMYSGVDVSHWNGNVRWGKVDNKNVNFVWAKISQGRDYVDKASA